MIPAFFLLFIVVVLRVLVPFAGEGADNLLWNFSPLAAIALCGAYAMPRKWAVALPLVALFLSDLALNAHYGSAMFADWLWVRYAVLLALTLTGLQLHKRFELRRAAVALLPAALTGSVFFFVATNSVSWMANPAYTKTLSGWVQALTVGVPGFPPTWVFFRNSLVSDMLFTGLFVLCLVWSSRREQSPQALAATRA